MTTNVNKFGLRKAASERTNRHAQRTALPPRPERIADAKQTISDAGAIVESLARSQSKAKSLAEIVQAAGWSAAIQVEDDRVTLVATRGEAESIHQAWVNGVWQYEASTYSFADRTTKPRNASGARKLLARSIEDAAAEMSKVAANKSFRKREPADRVPARLPFDPALASDIEILNALSGKAVQWYNRLSRGSESAIAGPADRLRLTEYEGERIVHLCCPVTGFRSFRVSAIEKIGRGSRRTRGESQAAGGADAVTVEDAA